MSGHEGMTTRWAVTLPVTRIRRRPAAAALLGALLLATPAMAQGGGEGPLDAPSRRTWVLQAPGQFRLPAPPDAAATRAELRQLREMAAARDAGARERIGWWNAVAPAYRWHQIAVEEALREGLPVNVAARRLAVLHTAISDAMVAAWDSKDVHGRRRPPVQDPALRPAIAVPASPSYPDEHAAAAATAGAILRELFPRRAEEIGRLAEEAGRMRLVAGVAFPSDVAAGTELGRRVAALALERARQDRSDQPWTGSVPAGPGRWNGTNPVLPQAAGWMPWVLSAPSEFRPPPPPAHDGQGRAAEMAELRAFPRTPLTNARALFWEAAAGGLRVHEYWNNHAARLLLEHGKAGDALASARAFALLNVTLHDTGVACWDAKYAYWAIRPHQLDPEFRTVFAAPNHPSYPAAHACFSTAASTTLAHLFQRDAVSLTALGREAGESRIWAGIHYPSDVAAGRQIGEAVATRVIERTR
jgi:membrane-associated phospholipid phosphatase